ncbi:glycerophosphodiester phosphodiesterase family protein [Cocleimonas sp. KMM 6892]|uniref:glycerophosphodiester phosphodiesterase family protein n=1 Tax=unclassified Cocleimonas TaxID=2639732 RepID=UPI002DB9E522|nr:MULTISPECIES: glycerophosphodiester phosphodiesterase family protein [unclassified Cocleimonas]MEB8430806.1 glycerophosphodiester phosphodiesterase family protein [Cocleimonas sp. KMM 6892]MEC4714422.1 glycerophosphodiester phosphodiesterase family protein [Cocleimonas sp. KMM 6895]MEC4743753.1 glycerophosphodiester phosphodiesterase family protein [Cocleimonas sp. KMM 6896]
MNHILDKNKLIAHRGDNTNHPENSYAAIESALLAGAQFIEFDIQMNADKTIIVFHDEDFKRMSDKDISVFDVTNETLKSLSIHEPNQFSDKHYPTYTSSLDEILALLKSYPSVTYLIEVKVKSLKHWGLETVMEKLLTQLKPYSHNITVISYSVAALEYIRQFSDIKIGLVFNNYIAKHKDIANKLKPDYMLCPYESFPESGYWQGTWEWMVYSINDIETAKIWLEKDGIDYIETDDITLLLNK